MRSDGGTRIPYQWMGSSERNFFRGDLNVLEAEAPSVEAKRSFSSDAGVVSFCDDSGFGDGSDDNSCVASFASTFSSGG